MHCPFIGDGTFRVSRIEKATVLEIPLERPPNFDLATHWKSSTGKFRDSRLRYTATARVDRESGEHFVSWRGVKELSRAFGRIRDPTRTSAPIIGLTTPVAFTTVSRRGLAGTAGAIAAGRSPGSFDRPKTMIAIATVAMTATMRVSLRTTRSLAAHDVVFIS